MRFTFFAVLLFPIVADATHGECAATTDAARAEAARVLIEARAAANEISPAPDRSRAITAVALAMVRDGDIMGALEIDKKIQTGQTPRPILNAVALAQYHAGHVDEAVFTSRSMKDQEATSLTFIALAEAAEHAGDPEAAVRFCRLADGPLKLEALLLAARIQNRAADVEGSNASLDSAKLLAHRQSDVAKVAETEALLGNIERAQKLMGRLRREYDQSRVLAAIVTVEVAARDFAGAETHIAEMDTDSFKSAAIGAIAMGRARAGQIKESIEQLNAVPDDDIRLTIVRSITELQLKSHGEEGARAIAAGVHDPRTKAVCLSILAKAMAKSGQADAAKNILLEAQKLLAGDRDYAADPALLIICQAMAQLDMAETSAEIIDRIKESDQRTAGFEILVRDTTRLHGEAAGRKLLEPAKDARERAFGLIGVAEGILDADAKE